MHCPESSLFHVACVMRSSLVPLESYIILRRSEHLISHSLITRTGCSLHVLFIDKLVPGGLLVRDLQLQLIKRQEALLNGYQKMVCPAEATKKPKTFPN